MNMKHQDMKSAPQREEALFQAAVQLTGVQRTAFLHSACHGDSALRQRLDALLAAHEQPDALVGTKPEPPVRPAIKLDLADAKDEALGTTIGAPMSSIAGFNQRKCILCNPSPP